jgi:hypothetical protein
MPRKPNPNPPGRGAHLRGDFPQRYHRPQQRVTVPRDIAEQLRHVAPDIQLQQLVESLLVKFLIDLNHPIERTPEPKVSVTMTTAQMRDLDEHTEDSHVLYCPTCDATHDLYDAALPLDSTPVDAQGHAYQLVTADEIEKS